MRLPSVLYSLYERRLARNLPVGDLPRHVGVILDGNRRWARTFGTSTAAGHRRGADKILELLDWCQEVGVEVVTLWMLSTDNLEREAQELDALLNIIEDAVARLAAARKWRITLLGALELLPEAMANRLAELADSTADVDGLHVNVAIGYGGRREIADAVKSLLLQKADAGVTLEEIAENIDVDAISDHLYTKGQPDPDLVIRTSGEQRLSGFLLWQSAHSEFYFCEAFWPDFRRVDFLRALRAFAARERRLGK
ncbi:MAG TPA: isoprenyl transferase [Actinomycetales bacterium]|nr:isoprenyl transferase [Actinomycetales bacterium]